MEQLKALFGDNYFIYGPITKQQAFDVTVDSKATVYGGEWYAATSGEYPPLQAKLVCSPSVQEQPTPSEE